MKKRIITVIVAAAALLTLTASTADADPTTAVSASGILVRHDDGYIITGTLRDDDSHVVGTLHGTLIEETTGFNSCPDLFFGCQLGFSPTCNLLGGEVTFNFQGEKFVSTVDVDISGRVLSSLCRDTNDPTTYRLAIHGWSLE
jgi:opacity protein-like surface antigen